MSLITNDPDYTDDPTETETDNEPFVNVNDEEGRKLNRLRLGRMKPDKIVLINCIPCKYVGKLFGKYYFYPVDRMYHRSTMGELLHLQKSVRVYIGQPYFHKDNDGLYYFKLTLEQAADMMAPY